MPGFGSDRSGVPVPAREFGDIVRDYRVAFLSSIPRQSEAALTLGSDLGRRAVADGVGLLELVQVHHVVLEEVLTTTLPVETAQVTRAACTFLLEVLSTFDMAHRVVRPSLASKANPLQTTRNTSATSGR